MAVRRRMWAVVAAVATLVITPPAVGAAVAGPWTVALALDHAYNPDRAIQSADALAGWLVGLGRGIAIEPELRTLLSDVRRNTVSLDLARLHRILPQTTEAGGRRLATLGRVTPEGYPITTLRGPLQDTARMGDVAVEFVMSPMTQGSQEAWLFEPGVRVGLGPVGHRDLARVGAAALQIAEEGAPRHVGDPALLNLLRAACPQLAAEIRRYGRWVLDTQVTDHGVRVDLRIRLNPVLVEQQGLKHFARYLRKLQDIARVDLSLVDRSGRRLGRLTIDTRTLELGISWRTAGGALVALEGADPGPPVALTDANLSLSFVINAVFRSDGVVAQIAGLEVPFHYVSNDEAANLKARVRTVPEVDLTGTGPMTTWLVNVADELMGIEDSADAVFAAIAEGPTGSGSTLHLRYAGGTVGATAQVALVEDALVRFGLRVLAPKLVPEHQAMDEILMVFSGLARALDADYRAARPTLLPTAP